MKKKIILLVTIIVIMVAIFAVKVRINSKNTVEQTLYLINPQITDNMYFKTETKFEKETEKNSKTEVYLKDKVEYERNYNSYGLFLEFLFNLDSKEQTNILHYAKEIYLFKEEEVNNSITSKIEFYKNMIENEKDTYEYCEEDDKYIKFSIVLNEDYFKDINDKLKVYFYINKQEKTIEKIEYYTMNENNEELSFTETFTYSYNTVKDEDILNFDINNYSDYVVKQDI